MMGTVNVEVSKKHSENPIGVIRRFTKRVRQSGILARMRSIRYHNRAPSKFVQKKSALKRLAKHREYERLVKLGKITPNQEIRR